jgi:hypothetical protein
MNESNSPASDSFQTKILDAAFFAALKVRLGVEDVYLDPSDSILRDVCIKLAPVVRQAVEAGAKAARRQHPLMGDPSEKVIEAALHVIAAKEAGARYHD